jgi:hypothetical protein
MQSMSENDFAKILLHYFNLRYSDRAALRTGVSAFASFHKSRKP